MGNVPSADTLRILKAPPCKPSTPVAAISSDHCASSLVTLHLKEHVSLSGDDFTIRDTRSGKVCFRVSGLPLLLNQRKTLLDANNVPVAYMHQEPLGYFKMFHVYADSAAQRPLFDIKAKFSVVNSMLDVKFENLVSKRQCRMGYDGDWKVRNAVLWLDPGDGQILTVARIYRPTVTDRNIVLGKQDYYVDVPPNIDLALIVLLCIALDEARND